MVEQIKRELGAEGFEHFVQQVVFGNKPSGSRATLTAMLWHFKLAQPPTNSIPIGSAEFRNRDDLNCIPREYLRKLAAFAGVEWNAALEWSLTDLVNTAAERQAGKASGGGKRSAIREAVWKVLRKSSDLRNQPIYDRIVDTLSDDDAEKLTTNLIGIYAGEYFDEHPAKERPSHRRKRPKRRET